MATRQGVSLDQPAGLFRTSSETRGDRPRRGVQPITTLNHPPFIRMESQSLAATGSRKVPYHIPGEAFEQSGVYRLTFRLRSRAEPMHLMRFCDATLEMQRSMNEWMIDVHPISVEFVVP